jgi:integrase
MLGESTYGRIWRQARGQALNASQLRSPLAGRPYDLRHSGVTLALNAGVPAPEVARRAVHGVEVLLRVYAAASKAMHRSGTGASTTHCTVTKTVIRGEKRFAVVSWTAVNRR